MSIEPTRPTLRGLLRPRKGRILAIKWGLNPNSSSLGVDVTFLLFGATALSLATPIVSALVRLKLAKSPLIAAHDNAAHDNDQSSASRKLDVLP